jgi:endo-1,4-beta-D-glucanase Y
MFPFPQNKQPGSCKLTTVANASTSTRTAYDTWKTSYLTADGAGSGLRVKRPSNSNDTVSEGIAYGMLAAAYIGDKPTFDGLWTYAKAHADSKGLMNWHIASNGTAIMTNGTEPGSATDADEDIAWALLMASHQWPGGSYLADAKETIGNMFAYSIGGDGMVRPGDGWGTANVDYFPDYFSPAYYRVFAEVTGRTEWSKVIVDRGYTILAGVTGQNGLVPDQISASGNAFTAAAHCTLGNGSAAACANYTYDACRTPWRIGMDYCFYNEPRAQTYLAKVGAFFNGVGVANIRDGYTPSGGAVGSGNQNMAFIGPAGISGMAANFPTLLDDAFNYGASHTSGDYFKDSMRVLTMLMMSGNFVDIGTL